MGAVGWLWFVVSLLFCFVGCLRVRYCVLLICLLVVGYLFVWMWCCWLRLQFNSVVHGFLFYFDLNGGVVCLICVV